MCHRPATDVIIEHAQLDAQRLCDQAGVDLRYSDRHGVLRSYLTEMEHKGETPDEFARRRGWI